MEQRRLSLIRLFVLLGALALLGAGSFLWGKSAVKKSQARNADVWSAPYVDATLTPILHFEDPLESPSPNVVLGFIVADNTDACAPSWGAYYGLDAASRALDMERRLINLRQRGGEAVVSFGGALNQELAVACQDTDKLTSAYQAVIDRYNLKAIDFDIEGAALADSAANARRAEAISQIQSQNKDLKVWLTLPVDPQGLSEAGTTLISQSLSANVNLAGVNVMTMDFGGSKAPQATMRDATQLALNATWMQLDALFKRAGTPRKESDIWAMIGATPMIGQNDVQGEIFTIDDAQWLSDFAHRMGMGRLSFWSANRDVQCGASSTDGRVSNTCSGVRQDSHQFAAILTTVSSRTAAQGGDSALAIQPTSAPATRAGNISRDDPRTSPYPIWRSAKYYDAGSKVVWQDRVYQAKWWNQNEQPDAPVVNLWDTPWRYLGPVLQADRDAQKAAIPVAPGADRAPWSSEKIYTVGDEVELYGRAYRAKWWTQGDLPQQDPDSSYDHPWDYLGEVVHAAGTQAPPPPGYIPPAPTPSPTPTPEPPSATLRFTPRNSYLYTVLPGDTISSIGAKYGVTMQDIMAVNRNLANPDQIAVGDRVLIPFRLLSRGTEQASEQPW